MKRQITRTITLSPKQLAFLRSIPSSGRMVIKLQKNRIIAHGLHKKGVLILSWELVPLPARFASKALTSEEFVTITDLGRRFLQAAKDAGR